MPRYQYQSVTIRIPKTVDHQLRSHQFVYTCGRITQLFKQALQELLDHDDQKIDNYLSAVQPPKAANHPQYRLISLSVKDAFKTKVQTCLKTDSQLKHRIISLSNYLRHVAYYYLNTLNDQRPRTKNTTQNPLVFDHGVIYQVAIRFDPTYQTYQITIPGFKNYQVIVNQAHQIEPIIQNFKRQLKATFEQHPDQIQIKTISDFSKDPTIQTKEFMLDLDHKTVHELTITPPNQTYLLNHHIDVNQLIEQHRQKKA